MTSIPAPDGLAYLPFQEEGIRFALSRSGTLLADEMGVGKTIQSIGVINADPTIQSVLIVCPAIMKSIWKAELEKWLTRSFTISVLCGEVTIPPIPSIWIINYDRLSLDAFEPFRNWPFDLVILDECHKAKNPDAQRTKIATDLRGRRRMALSGTPLLNRPTELLPVLTWLDPDNWPKKTWFHFGQRYGAAIFNGFGWKYTGSAHLDELSCHLRATVMLRRTKAEVLPELPAKFRTIIEIDLTVSDDEIRETVEAELDAFERFEIAVKKLKYSGKDEIDNLAEARHKTAIAKVGYVDSFVSETLDAGCQKLVLWVHHRDVAQALYKRLENYNPVILLGGMTAKQREAAMEAFQTDPLVRVFIGSISACGVGITLTAASHCVFAELSWTPSDLTQCEDRCHRIGQRDNVLVQHIVLSGSLDSIMAKVLLKKQRIMDAVLDSSKASLIGVNE